MSNYSPVANYGIKDALPTGTPAKLVSATELGIDFAAIATMSATKEDAINKGAASGYAGLDSGTKLLAANFPAFTGDVTSAGGALALTIAAAVVTGAKIAANTVTNANIVNAAANSIKGNNTGGAATQIDLTVTQATAMLNVFTTALQGLVPASGGGTLNFLRADGTFAVPPGAGTGTVFAVKAADESKATNTTIANDNTLVLAIPSAGKYSVRFVLGIVGGAGGFKWVVANTATVSSAFAMGWGNISGAVAAAGSTNLFYSGFDSTASNTSSLPSINDNNGLELNYQFTCSTTGNVSLQWAQQSSNATNTTVTQGSFAIMTKLA